MRKWPLVSAAIAAGFLAGAIAFPRAQDRISDVTIKHVELDVSSRPFPVLDAHGSSTIEVGGVYQVYFNGVVYVPGLGPRQKLFIATSSISTDGYYHVVFGDDVKDKGQSNAHVVPVDVPQDVVPPDPFEWSIHQNAIAAVSPRLNPPGILSSSAAHWPE